MSAFGDWFVKTRNALEADVDAVWQAIEPDAGAALISAAKAGVLAAMARGGSYGDMFVAARDAAVSILKALGHDIGQKAIEAAVSHELAAATVPSATVTA